MIRVTGNEIAVAGRYSSHDVSHYATVFATDVNTILRIRKHIFSGRVRPDVISSDDIAVYVRACNDYSDDVTGNDIPLGRCDATDDIST